MRRAFLFVSAFMAFLMVSVDLAEATEIKVGGMLRYRPEFRSNDDFNKNNDDKTAAISQRIRLDVKAKINPNLTAFIQLQDVRVWGETCQGCTSMGEFDPDGSPGNAMGGSPEIPRSPLASNTSPDLFQAWVQLNNAFNTPVDFKIGRQVLEYGDERLIGDLGWKDQARTFDAFKAMVHVGRHQIDFFAAKLNETEDVNLQGITPFDWQSSALKDQDLYGVYGMFKLFDPNVPNTWKNILDVYYLNWQDGLVGKNVNTYGFRLKGNYLNLDYTGEFVFQSGDWATGVTQEANALAVKAGYTFPDLWSTRIGAEYDSGSGDGDSSDGVNKSFVFPFHTNHAHYGLQDFFSWGNMKAIQFNLNTKPMNGKVILDIKYHIFQLAEASGAWLNVVGNAPRIYVNEFSSDSTDAGKELDITVKYPYSKNLKIVGGYSIFQPGKAAKERTGGNSDNAEWGYLMFLTTF
ncbi:hypothetical protein MNBD_NITROSPINAE04-2598 [hydrothermal vent metagenome]|uniref:Alginate export domain-containing protein n=1 Tax=hydrothermal vent metagenome TaxID=652676 RepID=A0A3B1CCR2_9ZZZZ